MPNLFVLWMVTIMVSLAPARGGRHWDGVQEEGIETMGRYWAVATQVDEALTLEKDNLPFSKGKTAAYVLSIAFHESGFLKGVDLGLGKHGKGDFGKSACLMQINIGKGTTPEGWTMQDLIGDRVKCFRRGIAVLRASLGACPQNTPEHRLAVYASGDCQKGWRESESRVGLAERIAARRRPRTPPPVPADPAPTPAPVAAAEATSGTASSAVRQ